MTGYANQAAGSVKQGIGKAVGSEELQVKGAAQDLKEPRSPLATSRKTVKEGANKAAEAINRKL